MHRLAPLLSIVALPLALTATAAANTIQMQVVTIHDTFDFGEATDACAFPVDIRVDGSIKVTDYFDNGGNLLKETVHNFGGPFTVTAINPVSRKSTTTQSQTFVAITTFNPAGSVASLSSSGLVYNFVVPGLGAILQVTGRLVLDSSFDIVFEAGPQDFENGNAAAFCNYLADP
jgi:hypothetical protein